MGDFHKEPSQEGDECDNMALKMWLSWTKTTTDVTIYPISEYFRQKFKVDKKFQYYSTLKLKNISNLLVYGRGFGIDDANCRQSAAHSFFQHLHENQLVPNNFLAIVQEEKLETNVEIKAACINRWNLFTELLNQPQCQLIPTKPFNEKVTDRERIHVGAFWGAFKQNLNSFSRKRKLTVFPVIEPSNKKAKNGLNEDTVTMVDDVEIVEQTPSPVKPAEVTESASPVKPIETLQMNIKESPSFVIPVEVEHVIIKESPSKPIEPHPIVIEESPSPTKPLQNGHNKDDSDSDDAS
uniref:Uncharacterized protein n=1 Tax=Panagrolaimus sp. ES5 TaxID=591445 RepID=A0AC34FM69_9BILA